MKKTRWPVRLPAVEAHGIDEISVHGGAHPYVWLGKGNRVVAFFGDRESMLRLAQVLLDAAGGEGTK